MDPPDGRRPALSTQAQARVDLGVRRQRSEAVPDGPEALSAAERCLVWGANPPLLPVPYNSNFQIVQTQEFVAIAHEMIHDARIIPLHGRPHLPGSVTRWIGDSRGHWEGDTLVVDTTNLTDKVFFQGAGAGLHVVERFTREDADTLRYEFTVDDPSSFARPWSGRLWMTRTDGRMYEYACHEANYSMPMILKAAQSR